MDTKTIDSKIKKLQEQSMQCLRDGYTHSWIDEDLQKEYYSLHGQVTALKKQPQETSSHSTNEGWKKAVIYAVIDDNGRFELEPTIYTETAKTWIKQGYRVTTLKTSFSTADIDKLTE